MHRIEFHGQYLYERGNYVYEYSLSKLKNGKPGKRLLCDFRKYSPLLTCECCGFIHGKKRVRPCYVWVDPAGEKGEMGWDGRVFKVLCLSCLFTLQAARRKWLAYDELRLQANKTRKQLNESTKNNA